MGKEAAIVWKEVGMEHCWFFGWKGWEEGMCVVSVPLAPLWFPVVYMYCMARKALQGNSPDIYLAWMHK